MGISALDINNGSNSIVPANCNDHVTATISAAQNADSALGEANCLPTNHPEYPLKRTIVATIRASLSDLCLRKQKATWSPSPEALKSILQQKRFTTLSGTAEQTGDLKSIVLHNMSLASFSSDFSIRTLSVTFGYAVRRFRQMRGYCSSDTAFYHGVIVETPSL